MYIFVKIIQMNQSGALERLTKETTTAISDECRMVAADSVPDEAEVVLYN